MQQHNTQAPAAPDGPRTNVPLLPLRDVVVYPHMVIPLFVGREKSIKALDAAMDAGKHILLVARKNAEDDDPGETDIYAVGTLAAILQLLKLPDGTLNEAHEMLKPGLYGINLKNGLLLFQLEHHVRGDGVGHTARIIDAV